MKKSDLRSRMVAETRNGNRYLVIRGEGELNFMNIGGFGYMPGDGFEEDLLLFGRGCSDLDIVKVYNRVLTLRDAEETINVLWERQEPRRMTMAQLEEELGYPVEIVKEG